MSTSSCCKGRGSQEEGTAMPLLGVHGVKDTATGTALVISRNLVSRLRYLQLQSKTGYGKGKGWGSFLCCFSCKESSRVKCQRKEGDGRRRGGFMKGAVFSESTVEELSRSFLLRYGKR